MQAEPRDARYLVWVLQGAREGDNAQARALAERLDAPFILKRLAWSFWHRLPNKVTGVGLVAVDRERSDSLTPPWPNAVIAVGRRTAPVAVWIKRQSEGHTRIIHLGRPRFALDAFDLVVTTPQYALPDAPNVVKALLPVTGAVDADMGPWRGRFAHLPRPWTGVLVGGPVFPYRFGRREALALAEALSERQKKTQGSLLVSTSPRSGASVAETLSQALGPRGYVHQWARGGENPHRFILAEADRFVVTEDSASMLAEACRARKPLEIFPLPRSPLTVSWPTDTGPMANLARSGLLSAPRNVRNLSDEIIRRHHARLLGTGDDGDFVPYEEEWDAIARRVDSLIQSSTQGH